MKLSLPFHSKKKKIHKKLHLELDPRRYWIILLSFFMLALAVELVYFSVFFLKTQKKIDAPATPTLETNAVAIKRMNTALEQVATAIQGRTGEEGDTSQNDSEVVQ